MGKGIWSITVSTDTAPGQGRLTLPANKQRMVLEEHHLPKDVATCW